MTINIGLTDIFSTLGKMSKRLQKVEIFPWEIIEIQEELITALQNMSELKLTDDEGEVLENQINKELWPGLDMDTRRVQGTRNNSISAVQERQVSR